MVRTLVILTCDLWRQAVRSLDVGEYQMFWQFVGDVGMGDRVGSRRLMGLVGDLLELNESLGRDDEDSPGCSNISAVDLALADLESSSVSAVDLALADMEIGTGCSKFSAVDLALAELACCVDE